MKKLLRLIRNLLVLFGWTCIFSVISNTLITLVWNFNFLSVHSWQILSTFWNQGGVIKTSSDILLVSSLILLPFLWLIGFILALKLNYISIFLSPFGFFSRLFGGKDVGSERIVIKNLKSGRQVVEEIKAEIESLKPEKSKEAGNIRSEITKKLSQEIKN